MTTSYGWIYVAIEVGYSIVDKLIDEGANVNAIDYHDGSVLMTASRYGRLQIVGRLIARGANVNFQHRDGATALMWASQVGSLSVVEKLIAEGADVNAKDKYGKTALWWTLKEAYRPYDVHNLSVILKLIEKGADIRDLVDEMINKPLIIKAIKEKRYISSLVSVDRLLSILNKMDYDDSSNNMEEKEIIKKYLVKRYGNILMVLWGKCPGFTVFEAIIDSFCPTWKDILTLKELFELCNNSKYIVY